VQFGFAVEDSFGFKVLIKNGDIHCIFRGIPAKKIKDI